MTKHISPFGRPSFKNYASDAALADAQAANILAGGTGNLGALLLVNGVVRYWTGTAYAAIGAGSSYVTVASWDDLATLEPATEGTYALITGGVLGAENTGDALVVRYSSGWGLPSSDAVARAYMAAHPIPAPEFNPFRSHIYLSPAAALMNSETLPQRAVTVAFPRVSLASFGWNTIRIVMADITGAPVAPEGVWIGLSGVDDNDPRSATSWVAATGLVAPPAGTLAEPGVGPVCDYVTLPSTTALSSIVVRIQMPGGTYTTSRIGTDISLVPDFVSRFTYSIDGSIIADPEVETGWGEAFGVVPWFIVQVAETTVPQCVLGGAGDSVMRGYRADLGGNGTRGMLGEMYALQGSANLNIVNLSEHGMTAEGISLRMRAFEEGLDLGGWIRQRASINDREVDWDYTTIQADASFALLNSDYTYLLTRSKLMIPIEGYGFDGGPSGWYTRFLSREPDEIAAWPARMYDADSITNPDGSYIIDMGGPDGAHPSLLGYQTAASPSWVSIQAALDLFGIAI